MDRRGFLAGIGAAIGGAFLDPERALWIPGKKVFSIPAPADGIHLVFDRNPFGIIFADTMKLLDGRTIYAGQAGGNVLESISGSGRDKRWHIFLEPTNRSESSIVRNEAKDAMLRAIPEGAFRSPPFRDLILKMPDFVQVTEPYKFDSRHFTTKMIYAKQESVKWLRGYENG